MEQMIDLAKGPLFAFTFGVMILGLLRLSAIQIYTIATGKGRRLKNAPWRKIARETITWAIPLAHLIRGTIIFSCASFVFHIGVIIVPLFLADHIVLWEAFLGVALPTIGKTILTAMMTTG